MDVDGLGRDPEGSDRARFQLQDIPSAPRSS